MTVGGAGDTRRRARRALSQGYEALVAEPDPVFDLVVVGSGYGGAVAAEAFSRRRRPDGTPWRIAVLERGEERLAGAFPSRFAELPGELRIVQAGRGTVGGRRTGLFDLRIGADVCVLVANGLGGGSLINAGVMLAPHATVLGSPAWPSALRGASSWAGLFERARRALGLPADGSAREPIPRPPKVEALHRIGRSARTVPITVAGPLGGSQRAGLDPCIGCGDCATGCNHEAKDSLDRGLLAEAVARGVRVFAGTTVSRLSRASAREPWTLHVEPTEPMLLRRIGPREIRARRVVLAAGTLGSTELLMRSRAPGLQFSTRLGDRAGTNGDAIHAVSGLDAPVGTAADERRAPARRGNGPTIGAMIDLRHESTPMVVQDLGVPAALGRLFGESVTTSIAFATLADGDRVPHARRRPSREPYGVDAARVRRTALVAMMGDDGAGGRIACEVPDDAPPGVATFAWPGAGDTPLFDAQLERLAALAAAMPRRDGDPAPRVLANPMWRLLPSGVEAMIGRLRGPLFSVHPLGGCTMGDTVREGVVDPWGRVFDADPEAAAEGAAEGAAPVHDGLAVLDGSIVPCALGINPALTITALAIHACDRLWREAGDDVLLQPNEVSAAPRRPVFSVVPSERGRRPEPTEVEVTERLVAPVRLAVRGVPTDCLIELTLRFEPVRVGEIAVRHGTRLVVAGPPPTGAEPPLPDLHDARPTSELRILDRRVLERASRSADVASLEQHDVRRDATLFAAPLHGTLHVLVREPSTRGQRIRRAVWAWASNRGLRDLRLGGGAALGLNAARIADRPVQLDGRPQPPGRLRRALRFSLAYARELARWVGDLLALASRAGEARRFEYMLRLGAPSAGDPRSFPALFDAVTDGRPPAEIRAHKRLAYVPGGNPFRQLAEATIDAFPLPFVDRQVPRLVLDTAWLARRRLPLMRIVRMESLPDAYADLGALAATLARMLVGLHLWSFRKPEPPSPQVPRRLPGAVPHPDRPEIALAPEVTVLTVDAGLREPDEAPAGGPGPTRVAVRLSRYRASTATVGPPIVTFHGYSASGTTFAHPALRPSLAAWFAARGRDVWVVDLRTSCGLPESALRPWRFEDVAWNDIPAALAHVRRVTGAEQLDVVAHCMGAVMFAMAVLRPDSHAGPWAAELTALPGWLRRVVLSQGGPVLTFSPANRLRAYVMSRKRMLLGSGAWQTRAATPPTPADDLLDRLLAALPYRDAQDFRREFPLLAPASATTFVRTRHRLDVLFGETFPLGPIPDEVLASIDDLFGPIDLDTVAQTIRFATDHRAASAVGPARPAQEFRTDPAWLEKRWTFETRHLVGARNGLLDPATVTLANHTFRGRRYTAEVLQDFGHQDVLIGRDAERFLADHVAPFLDPRAACAAPPPPPGDGPRVQAPRSVELLRHDERETRLAIQTAPDAGEPDALVVVGPWTVANVEAVRAGRCNDWPGTLRWGRPAGSSQAGHWLLAHGPQGCHAVFQVTGRGASQDDGGASFEQDVAAAVVAAIRSAVEGWTPPLVDLRGAPVEPARTLELYAFSCQYPAALVEGPVAYASMRRLAHVLNTAAEQPGVARWVVSMGDLVYVDATAGLFEPNSLSDYFDGPWERLKQVPEVRSMLSGAGANFAAIADDHEIDDNWEPMRTAPQRKALPAAPPPNTVKYERGRDAFQRHVGTAARRGDGGRGPVLPVTGDGSIFLADTRLTRKARSLSELASAHLLDESLRQTLSAWLLDQARHHPDRPKIVICPSLLLPRRLTGVLDGPASALRSDAWDGYPASMAWLFDLVATHGIRHLIVVSGDEHLSLVASAEVSIDGGAPLRVHSVHCSAMHAPYPFANARPEEFATDECFELERPAGGRLTCRMLDTTFARAREGFGRISVRHDGDRWRVEVLFMDGWNYNEAEPYAPHGSPAGRLAAARRARDHLVELVLQPSDRNPTGPRGHPTVEPIG